jgi:hypothetical protein
MLFPAKMARALKMEAWQSSDHGKDSRDRESRITKVQDRTSKIMERDALKLQETTMLTIDGPASGTAVTT